MTNCRLLFHLSVFSTTFRMMVNIVVKASYQLFDFLIILYMLVFIFGLCNFLLNDDQFIEESLASSYQLMFGENLEGLAKKSGQIQTLYVLATNFMVIMCLNILISIVTENYDKVCQTIAAEDYRIKAQMLLDIEEVLFKNRRDAGHPEYLFELSYVDYD